LKRDDYYLKDDREDLLKFNKWAESLGKTIENLSQKELSKKNDLPEEYANYSD